MVAVVPVPQIRASHSGTFFPESVRFDSDGTVLVLSELAGLRSPTLSLGLVGLVGRWASWCYGQVDIKFKCWCPHWACAHGRLSSTSPICRGQHRLAATTRLCGA